MLHSLQTSPQRLQLRLENSVYLVKTADQPRELEEAYRLRHDVFCAEYGRLPLKGGLDIDEFDASCDHLIVIHKDTEELVGTYRMRPSARCREFYSAKEFELTSFLSEPDLKLELGRACIHPDFKNGATLALLWRGIVAALKASGSRYLFGCSSVRITCPFDAALIYRSLELQGWVGTDRPVKTTHAFDFPGFAEAHEDLNRLGTRVILRPELAERVPPLLLSYLKSGAQIYGPPALDPEFHCFDLLTILDIQAMSPNYRRRFDL